MDVLQSSVFEKSFFEQPPKFSQNIFLLYQIFVNTFWNYNGINHFKIFPALLINNDG